jgi:hypothetical protein
MGIINQTLHYFPCSFAFCLGCCCGGVGDGDSNGSCGLRLRFFKSSAVILARLAFFVGRSFREFLFLVRIVVALVFSLCQCIQLTLSIRMVIKQLVFQFRNCGMIPLRAQSVYHNLDNFRCLDLLSHYRTVVML